MQINNGGNWYENIDTLSGTLVNGEVYVIANTSADEERLESEDVFFEVAQVDDVQTEV